MFMKKCMRFAYVNMHRPEYGNIKMWEKYIKITKHVLLKHSKPLKIIF